MGGSVPEKMGLGYIRKVAEQARRSRLVSSIPHWPLLQCLLPSFFLEFQPWLVRSKGNSKRQFKCPEMGLNWTLGGLMAIR